jgi:hypothetical protein
MRAQIISDSDNTWTKIPAGPAAMSACLSTSAASATKDNASPSMDATAEFMLKAYHNFSVQRNARSRPAPALLKAACGPQREE